MKLTKELQRIYDSEINFQISTFWDGGFNVKLGDEMNGFVAETSTDTMKEAILWLIEKTMDFYPKSFYSLARTELINKIRIGHIDTDKFTTEFLNGVLNEYERKHPGIYLELEKYYQENWKEIKNSH